MPELAHDERVRRLQRLAYGGVASDAERAAALTELESLRRERAEAEAVSEPADASHVHPGNAPDAPAPTGAPATATESGASRNDAAKPLKWVIAVGTVALLVGVAVGWQAGARMSISEPSAVAVSAIPEPDGSMKVAVDDTAVPGLFEVEPGPADVPQAPTPDELIAPTDYRLLVTRADRVTLHVGRLEGGKDVCAVVTMPGGFMASGCTHDGLFPRTGLWVVASVGGEVGDIRGTIHPDGTAELTPRGYEPSVLLIAEG
jgi:hypothetical protein